jgi:hypothetical protein
MSDIEVWLYTIIVIIDKSNLIYHNTAWANKIFFVISGMVLVLKSNKDIKKLKEVLADRQPKKKFDAKKFCGVLKVNEDALTIQHRLRDEWN